MMSPSKRAPNSDKVDLLGFIFASDFADISISPVVSSGQADYRKKMDAGCQQMSFVLRLSWRTVPAGGPGVDPDWPIEITGSVTVESTRVDLL